MPFFGLHNIQNASRWHGRNGRHGRHDVIAYSICGKGRFMRPFLLATLKTNELSLHAWQGL